ncbi:MAG: hypothetical protein AB1390_01700 [Nitrospirota bacterium]
MRKLACAACAIALSLLLSSQSFADGPVTFNSPGSITYESGEYYLTIPDISIGGTEFWAKWKLNYSDIGWDLYDYGLEQQELFPFRTGQTFIF